MSGIEGFCLKCKTYGPISNGKEVKMSNGRTRYAGSCSQEIVMEKYQRSYLKSLVNRLL